MADRLSAARTCILGLALALTGATAVPAFAQNGLDDALAAIPGDVREVRSAGRWRTTDASGLYRIVIVRAGYDHVVDRLYIQWVRSGTDSAPARVAATVSVSEVNDEGPFTFSHTLQSEATNRLRITVNATHTYTGERKRFVFVAGAPKAYVSRPAAAAPPASVR